MYKLGMLQYKKWQIFIQIAKRFDSLNVTMPPTNDHFKRHSVTYECPLNYDSRFLRNFLGIESKSRNIVEFRGIF